MLYSEAIEWIANIERGGSDYGLERERELLSLLGEPDKNLKIVHVAGTNGKGSVTAYLTSVLIAARYKVGTYNSPSVFRYNERFCINGVPASNFSVAKYLTIVRETIEAERLKRGADVPFNPTAFEIETACALIMFKEENCDAVVLETGLGGRWDATNAIQNKELAVITSIGLDHCQLLGDTVEKIADEKAQIIQRDAVVCRQAPEILDVIRNRLSETHGFMTVTEQPLPIGGDLDGQLFEYCGKRYFLKMLGEHQLENAAVAIEAARYLSAHGWHVNDGDISCGLKETVWAARFEIISAYNNRFFLDVPEDKILVLDGAHNPQGAAVLSKCVRDYLSGLKLHFVTGVLKDKDYEGVAREFRPLAHRITAVTPDSPRALEADKLAEVYRNLGTECDTAKDVKTAVQNALYGDCDAVVLCGSLTLFKSLNKY